MQFKKLAKTIQKCLYLLTGGDGGRGLGQNVPKTDEKNVNKLRN